jgi:formiminotetrahydrofolate cyclodeaminase
MLRHETIVNFLNQVALKPLTPAGGSVAALTAASAAALAEMAANLTIGKPAYAEVTDEMAGIVKACSRYRERFLVDIDRDSQAFEKVMEAYRLPKNTKEEQEYRKNAIQHQYKEAVKVPLKIAYNAVEMMSLIKKLILTVHDNTFTDAIQAYMMAETAARSLLYHARANLTQVQDENFTNDILQKISLLESSLGCPSTPIEMQDK